MADQKVQALKKVLGDDITEEQIAAVLAASELHATGDPVGTVLRSEEGLVAHRVNQDGVVQWRVTGPDGDLYNDLQPTLPWKVIHAVG